MDFCGIFCLFIRRTQLDISLQDAKSQLQEINQRYQEMSNNNTQMTQEFKRNQKELEDLRNNNVKLTDELKTLQVKWWNVLN